MPTTDALSIFSDVLEKMIDSQSDNTRALTSLKETIDNSHKLTEDNNRKLEEIQAHFSNGFRHEIMDHVSKEVSRMETLIKDVQKDTGETLKIVPEFETRISEKVDSFKKMKFWLTVIAGFIGSIAVIVAGVVEVIKKLKP